MKRSALSTQRKIGSKTIAFNGLGPVTFRRSRCAKDVNMHTRHKNHSRQFWQELEAIVGDVRLLRAQLKPYRMVLLQPLQLQPKEDL